MIINTTYNQTLNKPPIAPFYISGLVQADGSFFVTLHVNPKAKYGVVLKPTVTITLAKSSPTEKLLNDINEYFGNCGCIIYNRPKNALEWRVTSDIALESKVLPHFIKYPLYGLKYRACSYLFHIIEQLRRLKNPVPSGANLDTKQTEFMRIVSLCVCLNQQKESSKKLEKWEKYFGLSLSVSIFFVYPQFVLIDTFIIGLIDGDGCFCINFAAAGKISFSFQISGDRSQYLLFHQIQKRLACGTIQMAKGKNLINLKVNSKKDLLTKIIPFMDKYNLLTDKQEHYTIIKNLLLKYGQKKLTTKDKLEIIEKGYNMNLNGKRRKLTKEEYIFRTIVQSKGNNLMEAAIL